MQSLIILTWPYPILVIGDKNYLMEKKNKKKNRVDRNDFEKG